MQTVTEFIQRFVPEAPTISAGEKLRSGLVAIVAIALTALVSHHYISGPGVPILIASMGASAVLLFAVPHSPLAQPWSFVGGHLVSALIGVSCAKFLPAGYAAQGIAVGTAILAMLWLRCTHPPGGATALTAAMGGASIDALGYGYLVWPIGINLVVMLAFALLVNNLLPGRHYPQRRHAVNPHKVNDPSPLERVGFRHEDIDHAVRQYNQLLDISSDDLEQVLQLAEMHAYRRRFGEITCADIMSRDLIMAEFGTELEEIWAQLRLHKIAAIPVVDRAQRVIGIITLIDILKRADLRTYHSFEDKLRMFIRRTVGTHSNKPEVVGQVMTSPVVTVRDDQHIVELVSLLSDRGLHHIPVVNADNRLVGMVTQSDLIAALYRGQAAADQAA
ncbi:HPP family protein [Chitinivorax sp. PXF-14]|uniref:HPP family protein n=1 Tax=Chitinivorax sp. PXF-14 TaxID=3230488 RepID=UPI0034661C28